MILQSDIIPVKWILDTKELSQADIDFIKVYSPIIYWSDSRCRHWAFDTALPSGRWLENMEFKNDFSEIKALIL